jgi:hypothetical protein
MLNPNKKFISSSGIDLPILYVYLAGKIEGRCIDKCLEWRKKIIDFYSNYKGQGAYPISFLDALNSKEADSIDKLGLTSAIPKNLIYDKDLLSVETADVIVGNMEDFMEDDLKFITYPHYSIKEINLNICSKEFLYKHIINLEDAIKNRRANWGTHSEVAWALYLKKPLILIAGTKKRKEMLEKHPFMGRASVIVETVDELLEKKWLNILYKSISSTIY